MNREQTLSRIVSTGVVAVIRMKDAQKLKKVIEAVSAGGIKSIEITMTVPGAVEIIREISKSISTDVLIGAGTVVDKDTAKAVIDAGAAFVVGPILNLEVLQYCHDRDIAVMPGCFSPTEIFTAWKAGADIVKVFPATVLGPRYFREVRAPFPELRLMPTGGVSIDNVGDWIAAGAVAVGVGSDLLDKKAIDEERYEVLTERASRMVKNFLEAKEKLGRQ
ncbi:MAG: bifunctional 4-hydroxy-2-oxoglutarate aldolase/2-dehydro-3-deoxy-phosphogluconate aldolase [bacterium]